MAKLEQGILGPFRGKVGTVVGYLWRGRQVVRSYRGEIHYPNTENQQLERSWFVSMVRFAATARGALLLGLRECAAELQMTEGNAFVKQNKRHFSLSGAVDYRHLVLATGAAAPVRFTAGAIDAEGILQVRFERNGGMSRAKGSDRVYLFVYHTTTGQGLLSAAAERRSGRVAMQLPEGWTEPEVNVWGFVVDGEGRASRSTYIAMEVPTETENIEKQTDANAPSTSTPTSLPAPAAEKEEAAYYFMRARVTI